MTLSDDDVREILALIDSSPLRELRVQTDGFSLHVLRGDPVPHGAAGEASATAAPPGGGGTASPAAPEAGLETIASPMLGTFYRAEGPGERPFVEVGDRVHEGTTVAIIEVMKMMNSIPAGVSGTVVEVCAENGTLVEFGEPLYRVAPE